MKPLQFTPLLLLIFISTVVSAAEEPQQPWYQIELILFKQPQPAVESSEQWDGWSKKRVPINFEKSIELSYPVLNSVELTNDKQISEKGAEAIIAEKLQPAASDPAHTENPPPVGKELQKVADEPVVELHPFTFVPAADLKLSKLRDRISRSAKYPVLIHTAWIQPGLSKDEAVSIHLYDHMTQVDDTANLEETLDPLEMASSAATSYPLKKGIVRGASFFEQSYSKQSNGEKSIESSEPAEVTFNGTLKVILSRYLHVELNLDYAPNGFPQNTKESSSEITGVDNAHYLISGTTLSSATGNEPGANLFYKASNMEKMLWESEKVPQNVYHMQESRRMRSNRLHYLDHPKIGVLIKIFPVEIPQKEIIKESSAS